ncbi:O-METHYLTRANSFERASE [Salix viminalis]|uniref:O-METHYLTRANSFERASE n=1 Tax=Salix viminalis TaxID=40686 RepID=A0A9Q0ZDG5_SALVM|nr:O-METHYLTRANSFERASE [Salix viminalis]
MVLKPAIELDIIFSATSEGACACISPAKIAARIFSENPDASVLLERMLHLSASYNIPNCSKCIKENREVERAYSEVPTYKFHVKLKVEVVDLSPLCFLLRHYKVFMKSCSSKDRQQPKQRSVVQQLRR